MWPQRGPASARGALSSKVTAPICGSAPASRRLECFQRVQKFNPRVCARRNEWLRHCVLARLPALANRESLRRCREHRQRCKMRRG